MTAVRHAVRRQQRTNCDLRAAHPLESNEGRDMTDKKIIWTKIDEAPALATYSLLPIVQAFTKGTGIAVETMGHLSGRPDPRQLSRPPDRGSEGSRRPRAPRRALPDAGSEHHQASEHQRVDPAAKGAIRELQEQGYEVPDYPEVAQTDAEKEIQTRYAKVLGSAVNPVLREGNSDRRAPLAVKNFSKEESSQARCMEPGLEGRSRSHGRRRFLRERAVGGHGERRRVLDRARREGREDDGPEGWLSAAEERDPRRHVHEREGPPEVLRRRRSRTRKRRASSSRSI
jgi:hypothetical protein